MMIRKQTKCLVDHGVDFGLAACGGQAKDCGVHTCVVQKSPGLRGDRVGHDDLGASVVGKGERGKTHVWRGCVMQKADG